MDSFDLKADQTLRAALLSHASREIVRDEGQFVFKQGETPSGLFVVASGAVEVFLKSDSGEPLMVRTATANAILGLPATITGNAYSLTAKAITRTELIQVSREDLIALMQQDATSAFQLLA